KAGAVVAGIPAPVLGGAALAMFATVAVVGFQTLTKVDFHDHRNVVIVATSVGLAMYVTAEPDVAQAVPHWAQIIFGSGITLGSLTAIVLNIVFHHLGTDFGPAVAGQPGSGVRLDQVNQMSREEFVQTFAGLFQGPRWMVEGAWEQRPFADTHALRRAFQESLFSGSTERQRELIEAYPQLGSDLVADGLSGAASLRDQSARGLTSLAETDQLDLSAITGAYRERFGFPLVISVRDADSFGRILEQGRERLDNCATQEHAAALIEIAKIAGHRFDDFLTDANPIHSARSRKVTR
ncbi:MAG TPA: 2-oxo-4-hydroxy-4-carboxy-5-ureidoimidazoline decarboxylase, partial [Nocardioides sp.]|nr:2-oxo-4-hydroxy-4-carboxy-5-ureidoimidazoline decarboxylase [Nocardioides sp.]